MFYLKSNAIKKAVLSTNPRLMTSFTFPSWSITTAAHLSAEREPQRGSFLLLCSNSLRHNWAKTINKNISHSGTYGKCLLFTEKFLSYPQSHTKHCRNYKDPESLLHILYSNHYYLCLETSLIKSKPSKWKNYTFYIYSKDKNFYQVSNFIIFNPHKPIITVFTWSSFLPQKSPKYLFFKVIPQTIFSRHYIQTQTSYDGR